MKRSKMVNKLIDIVFHECYEDLELSYDEADKILLGLEKLGMSPPLRNSVNEPISSVHYNHEWDDEKK